MQRGRSKQGSEIPENDLPLFISVTWQFLRVAPEELDTCFYFVTCL